MFSPIYISTIVHREEFKSRILKRGWGIYISRIVHHENFNSRILEIGQTPPKKRLIFVHLVAKVDMQKSRQID